MKKGKTVGKMATELLQKIPDTLDPIEIQREAQKDYISHLKECVDTGIKEFGNIDFFVEVNLKKEKLLENVLRNYFIPRKTCPTPTYDHSVFMYHKDSGDLEYLWTVPDKETCQVFARNVHLIVPEERVLLDFVLKFYNGQLLVKARKLNGENLDTGIILEGK